MEELIQGVPLRLVISLGKIYESEAQVWKEYFNFTGLWPSTKSVIAARGSRMERKMRYDLKMLISDCDTEEHF